MLDCRMHMSLALLGCAVVFISVMTIYLPLAISYVYFIIPLAGFTVCQSLGNAISPMLKFL